MTGHDNLLRLASHASGSRRQTAQTRETTSGALALAPIDIC